MIIGIFGDLGSGKTLTSVAIAYYAYMKLGLTIYSNIKLSFDSIYEPNPLSLMNQELADDSLFLLDEIITLADSRRSQSLNNILVSLIATSSRKRNMSIVYNSQLIRVPDIRLFELTNVLIACENEEQRIKCTINNKKLSWVAYVPKEKYYPLYNTKEVVKTDTLNQKASAFYNQTYEKELLQYLRNNEIALSDINAANYALVMAGFTKQTLNKLILKRIVTTNTSSSTVSADGQVTEGKKCRKKGVEVKENKSKT